MLTQSMDASSDGTWTAELPGDRKGLFYTFGIFYDGRWLSETPGVPGQKAVGVNGDRAAIVDLRETDPEGWEKDLRPPMSSPTDIVIYEMHHRDLSIAPDSGVKHKGKISGADRGRHALGRRPRYGAGPLEGAGRHACPSVALFRLRVDRPRAGCRTAYTTGATIRKTISSRRVPTRPTRTTLPCGSASSSKWSGVCTATGFAW